MLYRETISGTAQGLLKALMGNPLLDRFVLVGGTALSLRIGHSTSIDLHLFTTVDFDQSSLSEAQLYHRDIDHSATIELLPMTYDFDKIAKTLERLAKRPNELSTAREACV